MSEQGTDDRPEPDEYRRRPTDEILTDLLTEVRLLAATFSEFVGDWREVNPKPRPTATRAVITISPTGDKTMAPGAITVDTTDETATLAFEDDHGDVVDAPASASGSPLVVTWASDDPAVATVANDATNPLVGDITPVSASTTPANISATVAYEDGTPVLEADGVTPIPAPASVAVTVSAGPADQLVLSLAE